MSFKLPRGRKITYTVGEKTITLNPGTKIIQKYKVAIYCRVSSSDPDQARSLEAQISYYRKYVAAHYQWDLVGEYTDVQSGRSSAGRKQFSQMIAACMNGDIDIIITKSVSRFGRNALDTLNILRDLRQRHVDVFFENENLHSLSPDDEVLITILEAYAQAENTNRSDNTRWGIKRSTENPNAPIYARPCFGYHRTESNDLVIVEEEAAIVRRIFSMYIKGASVVGIKRALEDDGIKTPSGRDTWAVLTIQKILRNEKYTGDVLVYKTFMDEYPSGARIRNDGQHEQFLARNHHAAIIDKELFDAVQAARLVRTNVTVDEDGNRVRKSTKYSSKRKS